MPQSPTYIASIGMLTPIGDSLAMTAASVEAGISGYQEDNYFIDSQGDAISVARLPEAVFEKLTLDLNYGTYYDPRIDRITQISIYCINQCLNAANINEPVPLVFAQPVTPDDFEPAQWLANVNTNTGNRISKTHSTIKTGDRAAVIPCLQYAEELLGNTDCNAVLIGGADCLLHQPIVRYYDDQDRLLTRKSMTGFTIGEGGCFFLLTKVPLSDASPLKNVAIKQFATSEEAGHLHSSQPYLGDGLAKAWAATLQSSTEEIVDVIYSTMNGEPFWSKELGVAVTRNKRFLKEDFRIEHPADCFGDLGSASGFAVLAIAAHAIAKTKTELALLTASSDFELRGSACLFTSALSQ